MKAKMIQFEALIAHAEQMAAAYVKRSKMRADHEGKDFGMFAEMFDAQDRVDGLREEAEEMLIAAAALGVDQYIPRWEFLVQQAENDQ